MTLSNLLPAHHPRMGSALDWFAPIADRIATTPIVMHSLLPRQRRPRDYAVATLATLCLLLVVLLTGCDASAPRLKPGDAAPAFVLYTPQGRAVRLADLQGRVVAVRFWADWCPYCRNEMTALEPVYRRLQPQGLEILAVNVAQDRETVLRFIEPLHISYPALMDPDSEVARSYGIIGLPMTVFVDRAGKVRGKILGESDEASFEAMARALLDENMSRTGANSS